MRRFFSKRWPVWSLSRWKRSTTGSIELGRSRIEARLLYEGVHLGLKLLRTLNNRDPRAVSFFSELRAPFWGLKNVSSQLIIIEPKGPKFLKLVLRKSWELESQTGTH